MDLSWASLPPPSDPALVEWLSLDGLDLPDDAGPQSAPGSA